MPAAPPEIPSYLDNSLPDLVAYAQFFLRSASFLHRNANYTSKGRLPEKPAEYCLLCFDLAAWISVDYLPLRKILSPNCPFVAALPGELRLGSKDRTLKPRLILSFSLWKSMQQILEDADSLVLPTAIPEQALELAHSSAGGVGNL